MAKQKLCCGHCFNDHFLHEHIAFRSQKIGPCSYCGKPQVPLLKPSVLADKFGSLISIYQPKPDGRPLVEWFRDDWGLFHPNFDKKDCVALLSDVLTDRNLARVRFAPSPRYSGDHLSNWEKLRDDLINRNRFFPRADFDLKQLGKLLPHMTFPAVELPAAWYRARRQVADQTFELTEMGAPPRRFAIHGRANPAGIPYLYLASEEQTAVAEVRPHTGERVGVAEFTLNPGLFLIDLRGSRRVSPFSLDVEEQIGVLRSGLLERLGRELSTPVAPDGAPIDYVPSQFLCSFIANSDYAGVIYSSSVGDGMNLALFDPAQATAKRLTQRKISKVSIIIS